MNNITNPITKFSRQNSGQKSFLILLFLFFHFSLFFFLSSCDLFTGPKIDLFQQISDEVDWSNAAKLSVRIEYPSAWGISNPQQGSITPAMDIRKGYEFSVEFTPDTAYTLSAWLAYSTSSLNALPGNWLEDPTLIAEEKLESLGPGAVTLPAPNASGGTFSFIIHTTEPVTLVPWCQTQPRITRTEPRDRPDGLPYSRASDIVLYFNGAINPGTAVFADTENNDGIWITAKSLETNDVTNINACFNEPVYAAAGGFFTVTISPTSSLPPENSLITVTVQGIKNTQGETMDGAYSFSWRTPISTDIYFNSYSASYNSGSISVLYTQTGADRAASYYRLDKGVNIPFTGTISNVQGIDASGVREGRTVSGIREYEIFIELYAEGVMLNFTSFKIWNFPGMSVSDDNPLIEIKTQAELAAMTNGLSKQYVLANDIDVSGVWEPVGTSAAAFTGKFYGNGHTLAISGGFTDTAYTGVFGYARGAEIRDLTVEYAVTAEAGGSATHIGGICGYVGGAAKITNCVVKSAGSGAPGAALSVTHLTKAALKDVRIGGMAGQMESGAAISNGFAGLNVSLRQDIPDIDYYGTPSVYIGGAVGQIGVDNEGSSDSLVLSDIRVTANVSSHQYGWFPTSYGYNTEDVFAGGVVGRNNSGKIFKSSYEGTLTLYWKGTSGVGNGNIFVGGIAGYCDYPLLESCVFERNGKIIVEEETNPEKIFVGGIAGHLSNTGSLISCTARGDMDIGENEIEDIYCAGIAAYLNGPGSGMIHFNNCVYEQGSILVNVSRYRLLLGGIVGDTKSIEAGTGIGGDFNKCYSRAKEIKIQGEGGYLGIGGFTGTLRNATVFDCGSSSPIIVNGGGNELQLGGFAGEFAQEGNKAFTLSNCWSNAPLEAHASGEVNAGGLVGKFHGYEQGNTLTKCWASSPVEVYSQGAGTISIGGLFGRAQNINVSESWASGAVTARFEPGSWGSSSISAGGLAGFIYTGSVINCYALGSVQADNAGYASKHLYSGGLVGSTGDLPMIIKNNFAAGSVLAQANNNNGDVYVHAGGIVGCIKNSSHGDLSEIQIQNNAALGAFVSAKGGANNSDWRSVPFRESARIYAGLITYYSSTGDPVFANNYAKNSMNVEESPSYGSFYIAPKILDTIPTITGNPVVGGSLANATVAGLTIMNGDVDSVEAIEVNASLILPLQNMPVSWDAGNNKIIGIVLDGTYFPVFNGNFDYLRLAVAMSNNLGNTSIYHVVLRPTRMVNGNNPLPLTIGEYVCTYSLSDQTIGLHDGPHGMSVSASGFYGASLWTNAEFLNFDRAVWNFSGITAEGHPRLKNVP